MLFCGPDWLHLPLSFTEWCRFCPLVECLRFMSTSAMLCAARSGHSRTKWSSALQWKQPSWSLTLYDLCPDSVDSVNESRECLGNSDLDFAKVKSSGDSEKIISEGISWNFLDISIVICSEGVSIKFAFVLECGSESSATLARSHPKRIPRSYRSLENTPFSRILDEKNTPFFNQNH